MNFDGRVGICFSFCGVFFLHLHRKTIVLVLCLRKRESVNFDRFFFSVRSSAFHPVLLLLAISLDLLLLLLLSSSFSSSSSSSSFPGHIQMVNPVPRAKSAVFLSAVTGPHSFSWSPTSWVEFAFRLNVDFDF